jgi:glyoxylase-like metal-dependent hydrolase (beta-lactamase superfamily II)
MNTYEIYALKYAGPLQGPAMMLKWMKDIDKTAERAYFIWCIKEADGDSDQAIVVDAGINPEEAAKRGGIDGYVSPAEMLSRLGVDAAAVKHVILTHLHWDHANGASLFPNATFYVQEREYRFWLEDPLAKRPPLRHVSDDACLLLLKSLEGSSRLVLLDGDTEPLPGVQCVLAPGHTVGLQAVTVHTAKGTALIGSDCAHVFDNYTEDWPSSIITNMHEWLRTYDKVRALVSDSSLLFPGHDPLMHTNYPEVADGVTRLV